MSSYCSFFVRGAPPTADVLAFGLGRRKALQTASTAIIGGGLFILGEALPAFAENDGDTTKEPLLIAETFESVAPMTPSFAAYSITPDSSETLNPTLKSIDVRYSYSNSCCFSFGRALTHLFFRVYFSKTRCLQHLVLLIKEASFGWANITIQQGITRFR